MVAVETRFSERSSLPKGKKAEAAFFVEQSSSIVTSALKQLRATAQQTSQTVEDNCFAIR